jgi:hypothetical protein
MRAAQCSVSAGRCIPNGLPVLVLNAPARLRLPPLQASLQLAQYVQMGPQFVQLSREHVAVLEQLEETEFELREIEQFRQLAKVTG